MSSLTDTSEVYYIGVSLLHINCATAKEITFVTVAGATLKYSSQTWYNIVHQNNKRNQEFQDISIVLSKSSSMVILFEVSMILLFGVLEME